MFIREQVQLPSDFKADFSFFWRTSKVNCIDNIYQLSDFTGVDKGGNTIDPRTRESVWRKLSVGYPIGSFIYKKCEEEIAKGKKGDMQAPLLK